MTATNDSPPPIKLYCLTVTSGLGPPSPCRPTVDRNVTSTLKLESCRHESFAAMRPWEIAREPSFSEDVGTEAEEPPSLAAIT
jgi:hypothetical protein